MPEGPMEGAVFVQTNQTTNTVLGFRRTTDGSLESAGEYQTGGAGDGKPHLPSQGSVVLSGDGRFLLVANAASDDASVFSVTDGAKLELAGQAPAGPAPKSIAEHHGLVYVLSTGKAGVAGFRLTQSGGLEQIAGAERSLSSLEADPAQVGFTPDGSAVVVTERGTDLIVSFPVNQDGTLGPLEATASSGPTPYGFGFTRDGILVVTEAFGAEKGKAAVSSYTIDGAAITPVTRSLGNGRSEICWAVVSPDNRYALTTNFADGAVSRYLIEPGGELSLDDATAGITVDGRPGLRDEALTPDGRFLYAVDADAGQVVGWAVGQDGALSSLGSWSGLPETIAGLAAL